MSKIDQLAAVFGEHVAVGWPNGSSGAQRVVMIVYDPNDERALRKKLDLFVHTARAHQHAWHGVDLTSTFGNWLGAHRYREGYFEEPEMFSSGANDLFTRHAAETVLQALRRTEHNEREIVGVVGAASLFGAASLSDVLTRVDHAVKGRLAVFFPGRANDGRYRLLDARDGWNYHAVAIQIGSSGAHQ